MMWLFWRFINWMNDVELKAWILANAHNPKLVAKSQALAAKDEWIARRSAGRKP